MGEKQRWQTEKTEGERLGIAEIEEQRLRKKEKKEKGDSNLKSGGRRPSCWRERRKETARYSGEEKKAGEGFSNFAPQVGKGSTIKKGGGPSKGVCKYVDAGEGGERTLCKVVPFGGGVKGTQERRKKGKRE